MVAHVDGRAWLCPCSGRSAGWWLLDGDGPPVEHTARPGVIAVSGRMNIVHVQWYGELRKLRFELAQRRLVGDLARGVLMV